MFDLDLAFLIKLTGFGGFLWLGLFIVSRATRQTRLTIVSMLGLLVMALFLFSSVIIGNNSTGLGLQGGIVLTRAFWWTDLIPTVLWFHMTLLISRLVVPNQKKWLTKQAVIAVYIIGVAFSVIGTFSDLFLDYTNSVPLPGNHFYTDIGPGYGLVILFLVLTNGWSFYNLLEAWLVTRRLPVLRNPGLLNQLRLLVIGGFLFMVGGVWLSANFYFKLGLNDLWGNLFLLTGLVLIGYGVTNFSLLVEGQNIRRDFFYSFTLNLVVCLVYALGLTLTGANSTLNLLVVVGLAVITHTTFDFFREIWDKIFFSRREQLARAEARTYATAIASQPSPVQEFDQAFVFAPPPLAPDNLEKDASTAENPGDTGQVEFDPKKFKDHVRKALTDLKNPPRMITSPLLSLKTIEVRLRESELEDNRLNRVAILREWLIQLIENLRPAGSDASGTGEAWRFYNVLYYPYVREISRKGALAELRRLQLQRRQSPNGGKPGELEQILEWLVDIDEDTFYKWQRRASDTIASIISEQELKQTQS